MRSFAVLWLVAGCADADKTTSGTLPASGVTGISVTSDRGDAKIAGTVPTEFDVTARAWAKGFTSGLARASAESVDVRYEIEDGQLVLGGRSDGPNQGVDFDEQGPSVLDLDAILLHGDLEIRDMSGTLTASAESVSGSGLSGRIDLTAGQGGVDVDAVPAPGDSITIDSRGDTILSLPYGGDYHVVAFPDPDFPGDVQDLGFDDLADAPDYVEGTTGSGSIEVAVSVRGGRFDLKQSADPETAALEP